MEPVFLTQAEVLEIRLDQISQYGGDATVRDAGLLESALAQPGASFGGVMACKDIHEMAASYLFHIVQNHPFVDGNKRTGAVAAIIFLELNGLELVVEWEALADMVLAVASRSLNKDGVTDFFRRHTGPLE